MPVQAFDSVATSFWFSVLRRLLFQLDPEKAHHVSMRCLSTLLSLPAGKPLLEALHLCYPTIQASNPILCGTITLPNAIGLAAGFDKNAQYLDALFALGFGFIEVGTVTPQPQLGNTLPRLFRLPEYRALINRMGFNNNGISSLISNLQEFRKRQHHQQKKGCKIGVNIGKNKNTPLEKALDDYRCALIAAYPYADYITVNISSPNTVGLRHLQQATALRALIEPLRETQEQLHQEYSDRKNLPVPLFIKTAPDLTEEEIDCMVEVFRDVNIEGIVATNTTITRPDIGNSALVTEKGGLSGAPLKTLATDKIQQWKTRLPDTPIIGVGGIESAADALAKKAAGANAVQIYTGLIYHGPALIQSIAQSWDN